VVTDRECGYLGRMIGHPLKVRELLEEIARGEVVLPEIQRAYVWTGQQVSKLLDSLYREYPSGQILLWEANDLPVTKTLSGVAPPIEPPKSRPTIVLDGQQRLTSLYKALSTRSEDLDVYFHLETEQFALYNRRLDADPRWVSVRDIVNAKSHDLDVLQEIETRAADKHTKNRSKLYLDRLQKLRRIGEYKFPIEIFKSDDYEEVTELFVRINSAGTRLRTAELVLAQLALRLPGAIVERFEEAMDAYAELGFDFDARFMTHALIAMGTGHSHFRYLSEFWKKPSQELDLVWTRTRSALDLTIRFVRDSARIDSSDWLPSMSALIPLNAVFDQHGHLERNEADLLRWFYLASIRGRYSTSSETSMDEDIKAARSRDPAIELLRNVLPAGRSAQVGPDELDGADRRSALFSVMYAMAQKRGAKDWFTGAPLSKAESRVPEIHVHHIFPKPVLKRAGVSPKDRDEIANLSFLSGRPPREALEGSPDRYLSMIADRHRDRLEAQCLPMERALWRVERYHDFLAWRRRFLAAAINELIASPR
jgi:hypothetical protein